MDTSDKKWMVSFKIRDETIHISCYISMQESGNSVNFPVQAITLSQFVFPYTEKYRYYRYAVIAGQHIIFIILLFGWNQVLFVVHSGIVSNGLDTAIGYQGQEMDDFFKIRYETVPLDIL